MVKVVMMVWRLPTLTFDEFRTHYETIHVPMALAKFTYLRRYVRNYLPADDPQSEPPCDCITELWFDDLESLRAQAAASRGDVELEADELTFMDRARTRNFVVDERGSAPIA